VCEAYQRFSLREWFSGNEHPCAPNLSSGDTIAALQPVLGTTLALVRRQKSRRHSRYRGAVVDVRFTSGCSILLEAVVPEYSGAGVIRPAGPRDRAIVADEYLSCKDAKYVVIGGMAIHLQAPHAGSARADLGENPELAHNRVRVNTSVEIDAASALVRKALFNASNRTARYRASAVGPIYNVAGYAG